MSTSTDTTALLRPVIRLLYLNLAISVVLAVLTFVFQHNVLDYQVARLAGGNPAARAGLADALWIRPASVLLIGIIYLRLAGRLHLGRRRTYIRVLAIGVLGSSSGRHSGAYTQPGGTISRPPSSVVTSARLRGTTWVWVDA